MAPETKPAGDPTKPKTRRRKTTSTSTTKAALATKKADPVIVPPEADPVIVLPSQVEIMLTGAISSVVVGSRRLYAGEVGKCTAKQYRQLSARYGGTAFKVRAPGGDWQEAS